MTIQIKISVVREVRNCGLIGNRLIGNRERIIICYCIYNLCSNISWEILFLILTQIRKCNLIFFLLFHIPDD